MFVRIYNKRAERIAAGEIDPGHWVRVETETHDEKATVLAEIYATYGAIMISQDLAATIDFKEPSGTDTNRSRWKTADWWSRFLRNVEKARVSVAPKIRTLKQAAETFFRQWGAMFAAMWHMPDMGLPWLNAILSCGAARWTVRHADLMQQHLRALDRKSTRLNSSHSTLSRMPSSA